MKDINCPYCGFEMDIDHDDGFGYTEDVAHEMECHECAKTFVFHTSISYNYSASTADCLNGNPHNLKVSEGLSAVYKYCRDCDYSVHEWKEQIQE